VIPPVTHSVERRGAMPHYFLGPGRAYVYFTYGSSFMLNVTSEAVGVGAGVLLRALEPLEGIDLMQRLRGGAGLLDLARGPGRLTQAMQIDFRQDGLDLCAAGHSGSPRAGGKRAPSAKVYASV
jgi:3-methyladenine DNA glycosylase Mpg